MFCINPPGAFDPSEEWRKHLDELLAMERDDPAIQDAIESARYNLARSLRREREMRNPMWRLHLASRLLKRARCQPGLTEEQRREARRHAQNLMALHQSKAARGQLRG